MKLHVFQTEDGYDAGFVEEICKQRGKIVESWCLDTEKDRRFLESHGSAFGHVSDKVVKMATQASKLLEDANFGEPALISADEWEFVKTQAYLKAERVHRERYDVLLAEKDADEVRFKQKLEAVITDRDKMIADQATDYEEMLVRAKAEAWEQIIDVGFFARIGRAFRLIFKLRK